MFLTAERANSAAQCVLKDNYSYNNYNQYRKHYYSFQMCSHNIFNESTVSE